MAQITDLTVAERMLIARRRAGLSNREMARRLRVEPNTISNWELGRTKPRDGFVEQFAAECAVAPDELDPGIEDRLRSRCSDPAAAEDAA